MMLLSEIRVKRLNKKLFCSLFSCIYLVEYQLKKFLLLTLLQKIIVSFKYGILKMCCAFYGKNEE